MARRAGLDLHVTAAHRIVSTHDLAMALRSVCQQAETEPMAKRRREGDRGDVALIVGCGRFRACRKEMGASTKAIFAIDRP